MNEKYQQALKHLENVIIKAEEYYPEEATAIETLQELVDMMKPLKFEELEVGERYIITNNDKKDITMQLLYEKNEHTKKVILMDVDTKIKWVMRFEDMIIHRNIWEVE